ncbi:MAG: hypothetical protein MUF38_05720 [Anaerolineae bacterium]|jgi:hypothetical protein|nr:hypothetical protein [Anaerolineae bacterium]
MEEVVGEISTGILTADHINALFFVVGLVILATVVKDFLLANAVNNLRKSIENGLGGQRKTIESGLANQRQTIETGLSDQREDIRDSNKAVLKLAEMIDTLSKKWVETTDSLAARLSKSIESGFTTTVSRLGAVNEQMLAHERDAANRAARLEAKLREAVDDVTRTQSAQAVLIGDRVSETIDAAAGGLRSALAAEIESLALRHDATDQRLESLKTLCETASGLLAETAVQLQGLRSESARASEVQRVNVSLEDIIRRMNDVQAMELGGADGALVRAGVADGLASGVGDGAGSRGAGQPGLLDEHADGGRDGRGDGTSGGAAGGGGDASGGSDAKPGG